MQTIANRISQLPFRSPSPPPSEPGQTPPVIESAAAGMTVALYPGCMTAMLYPEQGEAVGTVLHALGVTMVYPQDLHCCGLIPHNSGDAKHAVPMAKRTLERLEAIPTDYIVSPSASCVAMMAQDYLHIFRDDPAWEARAERLANRIVDFTSFLANVAKLPAGSLTALNGERRTLAYHDSCQGLNALGIKAEPRYLIQEVMGDELRELGEALCCGFGGSFSIEYPVISERLMNRKLTNIDATEAPLVVSDNQGCLMHIRGGVDASGRKLKVQHIAELLAERIQERTVSAATVNGRT